MFDDESYLGAGTPARKKRKRPEDCEVLLRSNRAFGLPRQQKPCRPWLGIRVISSPVQTLEKAQTKNRALGQRQGQQTVLHDREVKLLSLRPYFRILRSRTESQLFGQYNAPTGMLWQPRRRTAGKDSIIQIAEKVVSPRMEQCFGDTREQEKEPK